MIQVIDNGRGISSEDFEKALRRRQQSLRMVNSCCWWENPVPVDMENLPLFTAFHTSRVVNAGFQPSTVGFQFSRSLPGMQPPRYVNMQIWAPWHFLADFFLKKDILSSKWYQEMLGFFHLLKQFDFLFFGRAAWLSFFEWSDFQQVLLCWSHYVEGWWRDFFGPLMGLPNVMKIKGLSEKGCQSSFTGSNRTFDSSILHRWHRCDAWGLPKRLIFPPP